MRKKLTGKMGSSFDAFLAEEGILEECEARAIKEILAMQVAHALKMEGISKAGCAPADPLLTVFSMQQTPRSRCIPCNEPPRPSAKGCDWNSWISSEMSAPPVKI